MHFNNCSFIQAEILARSFFTQPANFLTGPLFLENKAFLLDLQSAFSQQS